MSEEGVSIALDGPPCLGKKPEQALQQLHDLLGQLGATQYYATTIKLDAPQAYFTPNLQLKTLYIGSTHMIPNNNC